MTTALDRLAKTESDFFKTRIVAPVLAGHKIRVRIDGVVMEMEPVRSSADYVKDFTGWGVFKLLAYKHAEFVRHPTLAERQQYLDLFPAVRIVLCEKDAGILANDDRRFRVSGVVPIGLCEGTQLFDTVICRFDGSVLWFDRIDESAIPRIPSLLRDWLSELRMPNNTDHPYVTPQQYEAYQIAYRSAYAADQEAKRDKNEDRIKDALVLAGAKYRSYVDRGDAYTIEYVVGREKHRSTVRKSDLQVVSAGICLNSTDSRFDLTSLVGVIREGQGEGAIVRVGDNR